MYCRYCGAFIAEDSLFCAKCGKRLGRRGYPRLEKIVRVLRLKTPYPYFALLIVVFVAWAIGPPEPRVDYSHLKWTLESDRKLDSPQDNLFQQSFSLVVENTGAAAVREVPVELIARIEPMKPAEIVASFLGRQLLIMQGGKPLPLVVVLSDEVVPGSKRNFSLEGSIQAEPPFKVVYEIRQEGSETVLADYVVER